METNEEERKREREEDAEEEKKSLSLSKKLSLPQIHNIDLNSRGDTPSPSYSLQNEELEEEDVIMADAVIKMEDSNGGVTQYDAIVRSIEGFLITSSHYTPRDKREIVAQLPNFKAVELLITATKADGTTPLQLVRNSGVATKKQMILYYMVGKHGWEAALRTLSNQEDEELGLPKVEPLPKPSIHYIPAPRIMQGRGTRRPHGSYSKPASRAHGGAPRH